MSNNKRNLFGQGLLVAACFGLPFGVGAGADEPAPRGQAISPGPRAAEERFLLLSDGRLIRGVIREDEAGYSVTQKLGVIRYPKRQVERAFDTVEEAYRYRLERAPEDDPAERLRLARWCLSLHLDKEARTLLEQVVEISPDHGPARAMLTKMNQSEATRVARNETKVDDEIQKTSGEGVAEDRPGALDSAVSKGAGMRMGITGLPVIFDLPPAMAVRRAEQFKKYVHPVLQAYCAKCHNADYDGKFQLVPVKTTRQKTPDALRANLDATLRLIDPEYPAKSDLLSSTLRPHGIGAKARPIFSGSNDRAYQILAAWVASLRPSSGSEPSAPGVIRTQADSDEAFAADRNRSGGEVLEEIARSVRSGNPRQPSTIKPAAALGAGGKSYRYVEGQGMVPEESTSGRSSGIPAAVYARRAPTGAPGGCSDERQRTQPTTDDQTGAPSRAQPARLAPGRVVSRSCPMAADPVGRRLDRAGCRQQAGHSRDAEEARQDRPQDPREAPPAQRQPNRRSVGRDTRTPRSRCSTGGLAGMRRDRRDCRSPKLRILYNRKGASRQTRSRRTIARAPPARTRP